VQSGGIGNEKRKEMRADSFKTTNQQK
jgi:hypothetical protein